MEQIDAVDRSYVVDQDCWSRMSIFEQMGNISSEVGRSFSAKRRGDELDCQQAVARAIDLFDATVSQLIASKSPRSKEVLRAKESFLAAIFGKTQQSDDQNLERYFMQYAIASRLNR
jgi:hypothetical protein